MTDKEVMQMALDVLVAWDARRRLRTIDALSEALKKPEDSWVENKVEIQAAIRQHGLTIAKTENGIKLFQITDAKANSAVLTQPEHSDMETIASAVHDAYLETCDKLGWNVKPENRVPYLELTEDSKELDRASVRAVLNFSKRKWVGLTAYEIASIPLDEHALQTVEKLLKEKNT